MDEDLQRLLRAARAARDIFSDAMSIEYEDDVLSFDDIQRLYVRLAEALDPYERGLINGTERA